MTSANTVFENDATKNISTTYEYDSIGNILKNSDVSSNEYTYIKAHQLETAGAIKYKYDDNGNVISKTKNAKETKIGYTSYNKPNLLEDVVGEGEVSNKTEFFYAPNRARYKKILNGNSTFYIGKHYEFENTPGSSLEKNYN